ncbi:MAG: DEAD/DEAH box helicase [Turicibacter sp.]
MNFKQLGINEETINILEKGGIKTATPIQQECIPLIKEYKDVIAEAQTGTGKTLAFLLPIFENISPDINGVQALIITPTRELALQITQEATKLATVKQLNVLSLYGGKDVGAQLNKLKGNIHLVIATPGRLIDHLERESIELSKLKTVVLDEADQMLLMGFKNEVERILRATPRNRQTLCFSATMNPNVKRLAYRYCYEPVIVSIQKKEVTLDTIKQEVVESSDRWKQDALCTVLQEDNPFLGIIFCRTKRRADLLQAGMKKRGFNSSVIHSDIPQNKRERILKSFRNADLQFLIATDVASRGLDISGVTHIYNYDVPESPETYIHRIGRTGRAGEHGYTCMFVAPKDEEEFNAIERKIKFSIPRRDVNFR